MTDELVEIVAREIGHTFASLVSGNNQPVMSGDPRDRLLPHIRRRFDDACNEATLAALRAIEGAGYEVGPGWQPIETAPDDGSMVLIYDPRNVDPYKIELRKSDGGWWRWAKRDGTTLPTHWQPLPAPPAFDAAPTVGGE